MPLVDHNHVVQAFSANTSDHPFRIAILPRTPWCYTDFSDAHSFNSRPEGFAVDSVPVSNHKPGSAVFRKCFDDLLCRPNRRGMLRDIEVDDTATIMRHDDEHIEDSQTNRCDCKEINGYQLAEMIA